jgi:hypothetical protein
MVAPGDCSPSRNVVSKITTRSPAAILAAAPAWVSFGFVIDVVSFLEGQGSAYSEAWELAMILISSCPAIP